MLGIALKKALTYHQPDIPIPRYTNIYPRYTNIPNPIPSTPFYHHGATSISDGIIVGLLCGCSFTIIVYHFFTPLFCLPLLLYYYLAVCLPLLFTIIAYHFFPIIVGLLSGCLFVCLPFATAPQLQLAHSPLPASTASLSSSSLSKLSTIFISLLFVCLCQPGRLPLPAS